MENSTKATDSILPLSCQQTSAHNSKDYWKDLLVVILFYIVFWGFLAGFFLLLLNGVIISNGEHTLLWTFLVIGILFVALVSGAIKLGTDAVEKDKLAKRQAQKRKSIIELDP